MPLFTPKLFASTPIDIIEGVRLYRDYLGPAAQRALLVELRRLIREAPFYQARMPRSGKPLSVRMTNFGPLGWFADEKSYRYTDRHPETGKPWPAIPESLLGLWCDLTGYEAPPECCLVNFYEPGARMGLHRDSDEQALDAPVLSISLGDQAVFRIGGAARRDKTRSLKLTSGDIVTMGGRARLCFHGIDRILPGTSTLLAEDFPPAGRLNLTLRRVTPSATPQ